MSADPNTADRKMSVASTHAQNRRGSNVDPKTLRERKISVASSHQTQEKSAGGLKASILARQFVRNIQSRGKESDSTSVIIPKASNVRLENTYKMTPDEGTVFEPHKMVPVIQTILEQNLGFKTYNPQSAAQLTTMLSTLIKQEMKLRHCPRYKFVCHVVIGQKGNQGLRSASLCLWDEKVDTFALASYSNSSLFAAASVFGLYYE